MRSHHFQPSRPYDADGNPWCPDCGAYRPLAEFFLKRKAGRPERYPYPYCKRHTNERKKERRALHRESMRIEPAKPSRALPPIAADQAPHRRLTERVCAVCRESLPIASFPPAGRGGHRLTCAACIAAAKPAPASKPTRSGLTIIPKKRTAYPTTDPARCVHSGALCHVEDARQLAELLHEQGICAGIVRGFFSTISELDGPLVRPGFETPGLARLFDAMLAHRTGRKADAAA